MKNTGLAPIIALLVLLAVAWVGLFGLSQATTAADRPLSPPASTATPGTGANATPSPTTRAPWGSDRALDAEDDGDDASFLDRLADGEEPARATSEREPTGTFLDRLAGREGAAADDTDRRVSATEPNPEDPSGLSNRGAAGLILVLLLVVLVGAKRGKG